jgi:hypothetical protein
MPSVTLSHGRALALLACASLAAAWWSPAAARPLDDVPEAGEYTLVYRLDIPDAAAFNTDGVPYAVDDHAGFTGTFDRVAYYLELQRPGEPLRFAWVSMAAFTADAGRIGVPAAGVGAVFQRPVAAMNVFSNVPDLATGVGLDGGNLELWSTNYGATNSAGVAGASDTVYDFGDAPANSGDYGSFQIHNAAARQTILAYNRWGASGGTPGDLGLGNNSVPDADGAVQLDWTFRGNAAEYTRKRLEVYVRPGPTPPEMALSEPQPRAVYQRDNTGRAWVPLAGRLAAATVRVEARAVPMPGFSGAATPWRTVDPHPSSGYFQGHLLLSGGWYRLELRGTDDAGRTQAAVVPRVGVGEVFLTAGQSNSANHGNPPLRAADDRVSAWGPEGWRHADDPQPIATGALGSPWPALGDRLAADWGVPIGFISVGWGGTTVAQWAPDGTLYPRLRDALRQVGPYGARAVLWHQGESDAAGGTSTADYARQLAAIIAASRVDAGYQLPWGIALVSFLPGGVQARMDAVVAGQRAVVGTVPRAFLGPTTDDLVGADWRWDGIHFNEAGLREHARRWAEAIAAAGLVPATVREPEPLALPLAFR